MKAQKLPSGHFRAIAYLGKDEDGKRITKSFTAVTASKAVALASAYQDKYSMRVSRDSLSTAMETFIRAKEPVLSPTTISDYHNRARTLRAQFSAICARPVVAVTSDDLQEIVNTLLSPHQFHRGNKDPHPASSKTVRNYVMFLSAVFRHEGITMPPVQLPQKVQADLYIPTFDEVRRLLTASEGTEMYIPVALAAFAPLRRGEICALRYPEDFEGNRIHVQGSIALTRTGEWVRKPPKSHSSDRFIVLNDWIIEEITRKEYVTNLNPREITSRFNHLLNAAGLPHFRFQDLRHFCVSYLHSIGVPDAYIIQRTGHSGEAILKRVYRHILADQDARFVERAIRGFDAAMGLAPDTGDGDFPSDGYTPDHHNP